MKWYRVLVCINVTLTSSIKRFKSGGKIAKSQNLQKATTQQHQISPPKPENFNFFQGGSLEVINRLPTKSSKKHLQILLPCL